MEETNVITIQDFSSLGQCSITAALPIISAMGIETIALPVAVLSAQTNCCDDYTIVDLQKHLLPAATQLKNLGLDFDFIYTGYLGQSAIVEDTIKICKTTNPSFIVVDPAMAEHGKLYSGISDDYVGAITELCKLSDLALPNVSEACMMAGVNYSPVLDKSKVEAIAQKLYDKGIKNFVITGIKTADGMKLAYCKEGSVKFYDLREIEGQFYGSGDVFASTLVGGLANGLNVDTSIRLAIDFTEKAIQITSKDKSHNYGLKFEKAIPFLIEQIQKYTN
ncbi:MAG: bifunctional hydroxymethylpyrimidine kinase/phosphomethylpyrimidine kinase [Clostridia bacterium]|nr:bifunctional hydroxymethylpyrimidine kinase/phosphomethylpyrimidine kinase [Clostridia bacterium]